MCSIPKINFIALSFPYILPNLSVTPIAWSLVARSQHPNHTYVEVCRVQVTVKSLGWPELKTVEWTDNHSRQRQLRSCCRRRDFRAIVIISSTAFFLLRLFFWPAILRYLAVCLHSILGSWWSSLTRVGSWRVGSTTFGRLRICIWRVGRWKVWSGRVRLSKITRWKVGSWRAGL